MNLEITIKSLVKTNIIRKPKRKIYLYITNLQYVNINIRWMWYRSTVIFASQNGARNYTKIELPSTGIAWQKSLCIRALIQINHSLYLDITNILVVSPQVEVHYIEVFHIANPWLNKPIQLVLSDFVKSRFQFFFFDLRMLCMMWRLTWQPYNIYVFKL